jgi:hypothetical protein
MGVGSGAVTPKPPLPPTFNSWLCRLLAAGEFKRANAFILREIRKELEEART